MNALSITTVIGCRVACDFCPQRMLTVAYRQKTGPREMTLETFKTCLAKVPEAIPIHFAGFSEPWLNPRCTEMVLHAHRQGRRLRVYTTLVGMTLADFEQLPEIPFEEFEVHLPARRSMENITVDEVYQELVQRLQASEIPARFHVHGDDLHPALKPLVPKVEYWRLFNRAQNLGEPTGARGRRRRRRGTIGCSRLHCNILIPNGDVVICCMDYGTEHVIGNLLEGDYDDLFRGGEYARILRGFEDESEEILCRYCDTYAVDRDWRARIHNLSFRLIPLWAKVRSKTRRLLPHREHRVSAGGARWKR
jgi:hypothetical protein